MKRLLTKHCAVFAALVCSSPFLFGQGAPDIVWTGPGHTGINGLAVSPDGQTLATASLGDETIKLWNASEGKLLHTLA
jgi:WD40 repeat protein